MGKGHETVLKNQRLLTRGLENRDLLKSDTALMNVFCPCCAFCWQITVQCAIQIACLLRNRRQLCGAVEQNSLCHGVSGHVVHEPQPSACGCGMHFAFRSLCFPLASAPHTHTHTNTHTHSRTAGLFFLSCWLGLLGFCIMEYIAGDGPSMTSFLSEASPARISDNSTVCFANRIRLLQRFAKVKSMRDRKWNKGISAGQKTC